MNLLKLLRKINGASFLQLLIMVLHHPEFVWPTYKATKQCMALSNQCFGRAHYRNGPANAFRHALWNFLILYHCTKWSKKEGRLLFWTKSITNWHEEAFFSRQLAKQMDLHNNQLGRQLFKKYQKPPAMPYLELLISMTNNAVKIAENTDLKKIENQLVYIAEE